MADSMTVWILVHSIAFLTAITSTSSATLKRAARVVVKKKVIYRSLNCNLWTIPLQMALQSCRPTAAISKATQMALNKVVQFPIVATPPVRPVFDRPTV